MKSIEIYVVECIDKKTKHRSFSYYSMFLSAKRYAEYLLHFNYMVLVYPSRLITD